MTLPLRPPAGPLRRDPDRGLWWVTRYADVVTALGDDRLGIAGGTEPTARAALARTAAVAREVLTTDAWRDIASTCGPSTSEGHDEEWVGDYARPFAMALTARVTGLAEDAVVRHAVAAGRVFQAAAGARSPNAARAHVDAVAELARELPMGIELQAFVALTHTLPALIAGAWKALAGAPSLWTDSHRVQGPGPIDRPRIADSLLDELVRLGSPVEVVFRIAAAPIPWGDQRIEAGDAVAIAIGAAQRDPAAFPDGLAPHREAHGDTSLTFGRGAHACPGARLMRDALRWSTAQRVASVPNIGAGAEATWEGGLALRWVSSLRIPRGGRSLPNYL